MAGIACEPEYPERRIIGITARPHVPLGTLRTHRPCIKLDRRHRRKASLVPRKPPPAQQRPETPRLTESIESARAKLQARVEIGEELLRRRVNSGEDFQKLEVAQKAWSDYDQALLRCLFTTNQLEREYAWAVGQAVASYGLAMGVDQLRRCRQAIFGRVEKLKSIIARLELYADDQTPVASLPTPTANQDFTHAFVVHGRDDASKEAVARFLASLGIEPIVLHEQASGGRTIIEKLEHYGSVPFAVVLLTPDDEGRLAGSDDAYTRRARQNVLLELGFFVGKLGRKNVCALCKHPVDVPSDWEGVVWVQMDVYDGWKIRLAKELKAAGFVVDMNAQL